MILGNNISAQLIYRENHIQKGVPEQPTALSSEKTLFLSPNFNT